MRKNQWATELFGFWSLQHILPQRQQFTNSESFDDLVARNTMVVTRNLVAMAKSLRLFRLLVFKIFTRGPNHKKQKHAYFTQLPFSIANLRTALQSSAYLPEIEWNKL
jgi:hypothetical protein